MEIKFKEDENGRIHDSDAIFEKIDEQLDNEEYDAVVSRILAIPRGKWSNKLRFKLVCAYNNQHDFEKSEAELDELAPLCQSGEDMARYRYMRGYICYMTDREIMARFHYSAAVQLAPEYAKSIELKDEIAECTEIIEKDYANMSAMLVRMFDDLQTRCEKQNKLSITDEQFQLRLGFFPAIRKIPGFEHPVGLDNYFMQYNDEDKAKCLQWFERFYGITNEDTFFDFIQNGFVNNVSRMTNDVLAYLIGKPNFELSQLNESGRLSFESCVGFVKGFGKFIPNAGVLAWDIGEKIGFARHAYYSGLIGNFDYCKGLLTLADAARENFSSWNEYMRSLLCGAALYMFNMDNFSISGAMEFMNNMFLFLMNSDLPDVEWKSSN
ncbi:MAG: DUF1266 domain-containing protein [Oscillospiraceae bacterium]|nr:DUF1266 domain-containing protein [Oscillospiraceae bacterium]